MAMVPSVPWELIRELIRASYTTAPTSSSTVWPVWSVLDCDGDGTNNGNDPQPQNPCVPGTGTPDPTNPIWAAADCDNDGESNGYRDQ
jgi:hypothetical protein